MTITIVTLYDDRACEHYVGAVEGSLTDEQRHEIAARFEAEYGVEDEDEDGRYMYFREVDLIAKAEGLRHLMNHCDGGVTLNQFGHGEHEEDE